MDKTPKIHPLFIFTKMDSGDFDRDAVTQQLCIVPSETNGPCLSKGMVSCETNIQEMSNELSGITIIPATKSPYRLLKHAYWCFELPEESSWSVNESVQRLESVLKEKVSTICDCCRNYNLKVDLIIRISTKPNIMPELFISNESILFWASIGASISFDFGL